LGMPSVFARFMNSLTLMFVIHFAANVMLH
jgi:hypothetical protein